MDNRTYVLAAALVVMIAVGMLLFTYFSSTEFVLDHQDSRLDSSNNEPVVDDVPQSDAPTTSDEPVEDVPPPLVLNRTDRDGSTFISGTITTPTPCHQIQTETVILESYPEQVIIDMQLQASGDLCVQVLADKEWTVEMGAVSPEALFTLQVDGQVLSTEVLTEPQ